MNDVIRHLIDQQLAEFVPAMSLRPGLALVEADGYAATIATVERNGAFVCGALEPGIGIVSPKTFRVKARSQVLVARAAQD